MFTELLQFLFTKKHANLNNVQITFNHHVD